jgi:nonsense-mediated mRNA decay protein 3
MQPCPGPKDLAMASGKFCYLCGKITEKLEEGLCISCYPKEKKLAHLPKKIEVEVCRGCSRYYSGKWVDIKGPPNKMIEIISREAVKSSLEPELWEIPREVRILKTVEKCKTIVSDVEVELSKRIGAESHAQLQTSLVLKQTLCPVCSKRAGGYFEAIIQLRTDDIDKIFGEAFKVINRLYEKDQMAFVVDETKVKGGVDLKIGSGKAARVVGTHFKTHYGAQIKESAKLSGKKDGKNVYRKTILIRV